MSETSLEKSAPTDSPRWMRLIASPMSGATDSVVILGIRLRSGSGTESVRTTSRRLRGRDPVDGRVAQDAVRGAGVDLGHALALERADDLDQRAGGVDLVVDDDRALAADVADDVHQLGPVEVADAPLLDDRQRRVEQLGERPGALGEAEVGDDDQVLDLLVAEVVREHVDRGQLVDRDVEEALDLALVEVHRQDPVGAGDRDHVGDQAGRDRDARLVLLVRAAVGVERDDRGDPPGAGALEGVDHDQQFHDRLVDRVAGRLDEEDVLLADVLEDLDEDVLVRELEDLGAPGSVPR